jgi:hypothetical protein
MLPNVDLSAVRNSVGAAAMLLLVVGLIWSGE